MAALGNSGTKIQLLYEMTKKKAEKKGAMPDYLFQANTDSKPLESWGQGQ